MTQPPNHPDPTLQPSALALPGQGPPLSQIPNRRIPAWLLSLCLHTILFVGLLILLSQVPNGGSEVENRSGGIVLVNMESKTTEYLDEGDVEAADTASTAQDSPPPVVTESELPPDLPGLEAVKAPVTGAGDSLVEMLPGVENLIDGPKTTGKIGGEVTTEVFGVKGTGSRFVYVFDRSKSMDGYESRPMIAARRELLRSIDSLNKTNQFQIIFYNAATRVFTVDGEAKLFMATDDVKTKANIFVNSTHPDGGTDHINALMSAFRLNPDVIFLLTDAEGGFTKNELAHLSRYRGVAVINAIQFGVREGRDRSLKQVAEMTGGSFVFKDVRTLRVNGE